MMNTPSVQKGLVQTEGRLTLTVKYAGTLKSVTDYHSTQSWDWDNLDEGFTSLMWLAMERWRGLKRGGEQEMFLAKLAELGREEAV